MLQVGMCNWK